MNRAEPPGWNLKQVHRPSVCINQIFWQTAEQIAKITIFNQTNYPNLGLLCTPTLSWVWSHEKWRQTHLWAPNYAVLNNNIISRNNVSSFWIHSSELQMWCVTCATCGWTKRKEDKIEVHLYMMLAEKILRWDAKIAFDSAFSSCKSEYRYILYVRCCKQNKIISMLLKSYKMVQHAGTSNE